MALNPLLRQLIEHSSENHRKLEAKLWAKRGVFQRKVERLQAGLSIAKADAKVARSELSLLVARKTLSVTEYELAHQWGADPDRANYASPHCSIAPCPMASDQAP